MYEDSVVQRKKEPKARKNSSQEPQDLLDEEE